ncbi:MAG: hypothetical protein JW924_11945 [Fusobacteriaceae bacterium]|nr:hypothetical protein [Fusobacteriaceae bacterium]
MTLDFIEDELLARITDSLKDKELKNSEGILAKINCFTGWMPPKTEENEEYPFVMLRIVEGADNPDKSKAKFKAYVGACAYAKNTKASIEDYKNGHKDLLTAIQSIRQNLLGNKLIGHGKIDEDELVSYKIYEEQCFPFIHAEITINMIIPSILEKEDYYG